MYLPNVANLTEIHMRYYKRLRQKAVVRLANKPSKTLYWTLFLGFIVGGGAGYALSFLI